MSKNHRRRLVGVILLAWLLGAAVPAAARDATPEQVSELARRAATGSDGALRRLRTIDSVSGAAVDLESALDSSGPDLVARLKALGDGSGSAPQGNPGAVARDILTSRRFQDPDLPQPLRGPLEALAERLEDAARPLESLVDALPGEGSAEWITVAILVAIAAAFMSLHLARRRTRKEATAGVFASRGARVDPRALEQEADRAEAQGDLEHALRLRFTAGLIRLDARRAITYRPSLTTSEVASQLRSSDFDKVATIFDEVVYGRRPPQGSDVAATRSGWAHVLERTRG